MEPLEIKDERSLRAWLSDRPAEWTQSIGLRAALRAAPYIGVASDLWLKDFALLPLGAVLTSWIQLTESSVDVFKSGSQPNARYGGHSFNFADYNENRIAAIAADSSYYVADAQSQSVHVVTDCIRAVENAAEAFRSLAMKSGHLGENGDLAAESLWLSVQRDCEWLANQTSLGAVDHLGGMLAVEPVWFVSPTDWGSSWNSLSKRLRTIDSNYSVWMEWYGRRVRGKRAAFDIPGDKGRVEDKKLLRRLAEATDEDFWGKGHEYVNATLKGWLEEARERAAQNLPPITSEVTGTFEMDGDATGAVGPLPSQNRNVLSFKPTLEGRITIDGTALADQLRNDQGGQDRYLEAVNEAKAAFDRCQRSNAAARLTRLLENYLAATGNSLAEAKPSLIVQRGERLRQELAGYEKPDSFLDPLADDLLIDLKGWLTAHNMMVGLDPVLNSADLAMLGPDRQPALIPPDEIREKVQQADDADILDIGVAETVIEATYLAPIVPDANDRRTLWSIEVARNLIIESVGIALNPTNEEAQAAAHISVAGVRAICGSLEHSKYIVENREWILNRLGSTPTLKELIERLADRLEKITAFAPK